jgi:hypothetical protein
MIRFIWDKNKARKNLVKHTTGFDETTTVFYYPLAFIFDDEPHSEFEKRL